MPEKGQPILLYSTEPEFSDGVMSSELIFGFADAWWRLGKGHNLGDPLNLSPPPDKNHDFVFGPDGKPVRSPKILEDIVVLVNLPQPIVVFTDGTFATNYAGACRTYCPVVEYVEEWAWIFDIDDQHLFNSNLT